MKYKILINASTCVAGGGVQVASSYISEALKDNYNYNYFFVVSSSVYNDLSEKNKKNKNIIVLLTSPAKLLRGRKSRISLLKIEKDFKPNIVFTIFGPAYVKFKNKHLCGIADGWLTHKSKIAFDCLSHGQKGISLLRSYYKKYKLSSKDFYWVEAEVAKKGLRKIINVKNENIKVISNTFSSNFNDSRTKNTDKKKCNFIKILTIAHPYPHKNLIIIPEVASLLKKNDKLNKYKFYVTIPEENNSTTIKQFWEKVKKLSVEKMIVNLGILRNDECPYWYSYSDIVFFPTLLETASAVYPEAMVMNKPIITTDLDFAHASCGDSALYFNPSSPISAVNLIIQLTSNKQLKNKLISNGKNQLKYFPKPDQKYKKMVDYINDIIGV